MNFLTEYKKIIMPLKGDFEKTDSYFESYFSDKLDDNTPVNSILREFFSHKGKRIRSALIFLTTKAMGFGVKDFHYKLAFSNALLHSATLIHDDIIDCSLIRRGKNTLNAEYDSKLAVLAGDYLLSLVLNILSDIESKEIRKLHTEVINSLINGELNQYFNRYKIISIEEYLEKSKNKTARLFEAGIVSAAIFNGADSEAIQNIKSFSLNFGMAFQIKNDLENLENSFDDIKNGDYSAPLIYYNQEKTIDKSEDISDIIKKIKDSKAIQKTENLAETYINSAIENISFLEDNLYKQAIINLCKLYLKRTDELV